MLNIFNFIAPLCLPFFPILIGARAPAGTNGCIKAPVSGRNPPRPCITDHHNPPPALAYVLPIFLGAQRLDTARRLHAVERSLQVTFYALILPRVARLEIVKLRSTRG